MYDDNVSRGTSGAAFETALDTIRVMAEILRMRRKDVFCI